MAAPEPLTPSGVPLTEAYDCALLDLDGVCFHGSLPAPHAAEAIAQARAAGMRIRFVTNNASRTHRQVTDHLASVGITADEDDVMTSSDAIAALMAADLPAGSRVLVVGADGLIAAVSAAGLVPVTSADDDPAAVVQGYGPGVGWAQLAEAAYAINAGAPFYAANLDLTLPTERGFAPGNGALVAAVSAATGISPVAAGKPAPGIFHAAARHAGAARPIVVGDRLDTDIAGANAAGYASLFVLTGVNTAQDAALAAPDARPTYLAADLRGLLTEHPAPRVVAGGFACGNGRASWQNQGGGVPAGRPGTRAGEPAVADGAANTDAAQLVTQGPDQLDRDRAGCALAWQRLDQGGDVTRANLATWTTP